MNGTVHADAAREPHILFSVSKSLTGALAGCLVADGLLDVEAPVKLYVPEVDGSAYGDATVRHVLDMTVSLDFEENYLDQTGAFALYRMATGWNPTSKPADLKSFLVELGRLSRPHGQRFAYRSPNSIFSAGSWSARHAGPSPAFFPSGSGSRSALAMPRSPSTGSVRHGLPAAYAPPLPIWRCSAR